MLAQPASTGAPFESNVESVTYGFATISDAEPTIVL